MTRLYQKKHGTNKLSSASLHQWVMWVHEIECLCKWSHNLNVCDKNQWFSMAFMHVAMQFYCHWGFKASSFATSSLSIMTNQIKYGRACLMSTSLSFHSYNWLWTSTCGWKCEKGS